MNETGPTWADLAKTTWGELTTGGTSWADLKGETAANADAGKSED